MGVLYFYLLNLTPTFISLQKNWLVSDDQVALPPNSSIKAIPNSLTWAELQTVGTASGTFWYGPSRSSIQGHHKSRGSEAGAEGCGPGGQGGGCGASWPEFGAGSEAAWWGALAITVRHVFLLWVRWAAPEEFQTEWHDLASVLTGANWLLVGKPCAEKGMHCNYSEGNAIGCFSPWWTSCWRVQASSGVMLGSGCQLPTGSWGEGHHCPSFKGEPGGVSYRDLKGRCSRGILRALRLWVQVRQRCGQRAMFSRKAG